MARSPSPSRRLSAALLACALGGCERSGPVRNRDGAGPARATSASGASLLPASARPSERRLPVGEGSERVSLLDRVAPPEHPHQTLALSRYRFAELTEGRVTVRRLGDLAVVARFEAPGARNVAALVGGSFLAAGRDHAYRISPVDTRARRFPRAPRLGPSTIVPSRQHSEHFWMHYEGIAKMPAFDLGGEAQPMLPVAEFVDLPGFDHRALLGLGDGGVAYTVSEGLRVQSAGGAGRAVSIPELAGRVFRLLPARRRDQLWAVTPTHAYRVASWGEPGVVQRFELPPRVVAVDSDDGHLGVLSVEELSETGARLRVDVHSAREGTEPVTLRLREARSEAPDAGAGWRFQPELRLSRERRLACLRGHALHALDYGEGRELSLGQGAESRAATP